MEASFLRSFEVIAADEFYKLLHYRETYEDVVPITILELIKPRMHSNYASVRFVVETSVGEELADAALPLHETSRVFSAQISDATSESLAGSQKRFRASVRSAIDGVFQELALKMVRGRDEGSQNDVQSLSTIVHENSHYAGVNTLLPSWRPVFHGPSTSAVKTWSVAAMDSFVSDYCSRGNTIRLGTVVVTGFKRYNEICRVLTDAGRFEVAPEVARGSRGVRFKHSDQGYVDIYPVAGGDDSRLILFKPSDWRLCVTAPVIEIHESCGWNALCVVKMCGQVVCYSLPSTGVMIFQDS